MSRYIKVWIYAAALIVVSCKTAPQPLPSVVTDAAVDASATSDAAVMSARTCPAGVGPISPNAACDGRFTKDGHVCAVCAVASSCLAVSVQVYCVKTCADTACRKR